MTTGSDLREIAEALRVRHDLAVRLDHTQEAADLAAVIVRLRRAADHLDGSGGPATVTAATPPATARPITPDRVRAVLRGSPLLEPEDYADLAEQANADPEEGADWLPYYKLALGVLMRAFGMLDAVCGELIDVTDGNIPARRMVRIKVARSRAEMVAALSLRPCGIGPTDDPAAVERTERRVAEFLAAANERKGA